MRRFRLSVTDQPGAFVHGLEPAPLERLAAVSFPANDLASLGKELDAKLRQRLFEQFLADYPPHQEVQRALDRSSKHLKDMKRFEDKVEVMVLAEKSPPRETHVLVRGVWDQKGPTVERNVPNAVAPWPAGADKTRLGLASWLVSRQNPLAARVQVNRLWQMLFGAGLVRTPEDFGVQGEPATHPELLDWLAVEFMDSGWDVRHIIRLIVTSAVYRQRSEASEALWARDPDNRLLARGARFRLPSWMLRDAALAASGLLNRALGGPPVRPYQPDRVWQDNCQRPQPLRTERRRRSVSPHDLCLLAPLGATTFLFDSAQRRVCEVRTPRTNTPLQALTLLNDLTYVEASRVLAEAAVQAASDDAGRLRELTRLVLARSPREHEVEVCLDTITRGASLLRSTSQRGRTVVESRSVPVSARENHGDRQCRRSGRLCHRRHLDPQPR